MIFLIIYFLGVIVSATLLVKIIIEDEGKLTLGDASFILLLSIFSYATLIAIILIAYHDFVIYKKRED